MALKHDGESAGWGIPGGEKSIWRERERRVDDYEAGMRAGRRSYQKRGQKDGTAQRNDLTVGGCGTGVTRGRR